MKQLAKNGLRYPIAPYGIQSRRARRHGCFLRQEIVQQGIEALWPAAER